MVCYNMFMFMVLDFTIVIFIIVILLDIDIKLGQIHNEYNRKSVSKSTKSKESV
jgi:hypothetical protein